MTVLRCAWDLGWPTHIGPMCDRPAAWDNTVPGEPFTLIVEHLPGVLCEEHYWHPDVSAAERALLRRIE